MTDKINYLFFILSTKVFYFLKITKELNALKILVTLLN